MTCRHEGTLGARWDYLTHDGTSGTGWITCSECQTLLERVSAAGGRFRGQGGRYLATFRDQLVAGGAFSDLRELEID